MIASHLAGCRAGRTRSGILHGLAGETKALLREAGITVIGTSGESWRCCEGGHLRREADDFASVAEVFRGARLLADDESVDRFLRRCLHDKAMREAAGAARAFVEGFDAADPTIASAQAIADDWQSGIDFTNARPLGGYQPMFEYLHGACASAGVEVCLSTIVLTPALEVSVVGDQVDFQVRIVEIDIEISQNVLTY